MREMGLELALRIILFFRLKVVPGRNEWASQWFLEGVDPIDSSPAPWESFGFFAKPQRVQRRTTLRLRNRQGEKGHKPVAFKVLYFVLFQKVDPQYFAAQGRIPTPALQCPESTAGSGASKTSEAVALRIH